MSVADAESKDIYGKIESEYVMLSSEKTELDGDSK